MESPKEQLCLGQQFQKEETETEETQTIKEYKRKKRKIRSDDGDRQKLFFDDSVPVEEIKVPNPEVEGLAENEYEVNDQKITYKLAQRPGVYIILKYVRDVVKKKNAKDDEKKIGLDAKSQTCESADSTALLFRISDSLASGWVTAIWATMYCSS